MCFETYSKRIDSIWDNRTNSYTVINSYVHIDILQENHKERCKNTNEGPKNKRNLMNGIDSFVSQFMTVHERVRFVVFIESGKIQKIRTHKVIITWRPLRLINYLPMQLSPALEPVQMITDWRHHQPHIYINTKNAFCLFWNQTSFLQSNSLFSPQALQPTPFIQLLHSCSLSKKSQWIVFRHLVFFIRSKFPFHKKKKNSISYCECLCMNEWRKQCNSSE